MKFRFPWRTRAMLSSEVDEEIAYHLAVRAAELEREGLDPVEAKRRAAAEFGDVTATRAYCLAQDRAAERRLRWLDRLADFRQHLAIAARPVMRHLVSMLAPPMTTTRGRLRTSVFRDNTMAPDRDAAPLPRRKAGRLERSVHHQTGDRRRPAGADGALPRDGAPL